MTDSMDSFEMVRRVAEANLHTKMVVDFVAESNKIESITRDPTGKEIGIALSFLALPKIDRASMEEFVRVIEPTRGKIRGKIGMNVVISTGNKVNHWPLPGSMLVVSQLDDVLERANRGIHPWIVHQEYETLHPFMDGNGRSGRMLWAWQMVKQKVSPGIGLGFLHAWYYQSLEHGR